MHRRSKALEPVPGRTKLRQLTFDVHSVRDDGTPVFRHMPIARFIEGQRVVRPSLVKGASEKRGTVRHVLGVTAGEHAGSWFYIVQWDSARRGQGLGRREKLPEQLLDVCEE